MANPSYQPKVYREQGGSRQVVASGGSLDIESGGELDIESGGSLKLAGTAITATAAEINQAADVSDRFEVVTTTNPITAAENGKTFFLSHATGFVSTLPAPAAGLRYKFIVGATPPSSGNHTVVTTTSANIIFGVLAAATEDDVGAIASQEDTISFVASAALPGDWVEVVSDGTNWYVTGCATVAEAITTTQAG